MELAGWAELGLISLIKIKKMKHAWQQLNKKKKNCLEPVRSVTQRAAGMLFKPQSCCEEFSAESCLKVCMFDCMCER